MLPQGEIPLSGGTPEEASDCITEPLRATPKLHSPSTDIPQTSWGRVGPIGPLSKAQGKTTEADAAYDKAK